MLQRKIYLSDEKIKNISIFDGYKDFYDLTNEISSYGQSPESYYIIRFCNMLYAFFYNDWNEIIMGKDTLYYINLDSHICKRSKKDNKFDWPYSNDEIDTKCVPSATKYGVANDLIRIDKMIAIYYCKDEKWYAIHPFKEKEDFYNILNEFGKQFYRDFFFSRIEVHMYLKRYFDDAFLSHMDKFYVNGAFEVNPFTWKVTTDNTMNTKYCSFYDTITKKEICEMGGKFFKI